MHQTEGLRGNHGLRAISGVIRWEVRARGGKGMACLTFLTSVSNIPQTKQILIPVFTLIK